MIRLWGRLDALEEQHRLSNAEGVGQREPDLGFAWAAYRWASGYGLDAVRHSVAIEEREGEHPALPRHRGRAR